jgi:DNA-binding NarL/FixJ family response regulator
MIKVLLADDHPMVREGLRLAINSTSGQQVIGTAGNAAEALQLIASLKPDLLLTDISMPGVSGIELTREALKQNPGLKVIIMSMHENDAYINNAVQAGAQGYLLKDSDKNELSEAIQMVMDGGKYFSKSVSQILVNGMYNKQEDASVSDNSGLSNREIEVLRLIAQGLSNKEIAAKLFLSVRTIDAHRYNIMQKLDVKNTAEMIRSAVKLKIVEF